MPHVIYLHSSLTADRFRARRDLHSLPGLLRATRIDVTCALLMAGVLNMALLVVAASSLHGVPGAESLEGVHRLITSRVGSGVALLFSVSLLCSGLASTSVGCAAGAEVMRDLLRRQVSPLIRRIVTVAPAVAMLALGADPSRTLVVSQVVLSMGIPFALVPLVVLTARRSVMGDAVNSSAMTYAAATVGGVVIALNLTLLFLTLKH